MPIKDIEKRKEYDRLRARIKYHIDPDKARSAAKLKYDRVRHREYTVKYRLKNRDIVLKQRAEYVRNRRRTDSTFRFRGQLRCKIGKYLKGTYKTSTIIGLNIIEFRNYIASKFTDGMTWENYGSWHIDHIVPISCANSEIEIIMLWHYTNLQPLWCKDNLRKSDSVSHLFSSWPRVA